MKRIDLTGKKFGMLTILSYAGRMKSGTGWNARCDCGNELVVNGGHLTQKGYAKKSCGCLKTNTSDMLGQKFGRLTVKEKIAGVGTGNQKRRTARCECDCGGTIDVDPYELRTGHTRSCGCLLHEPQAKDKVGDRYGKLVVLERAESRGPSNKLAIWRCRCDCGNVVSITATNLVTGNSTQCESCRHEALAASNAAGISKGEKEMVAYIESLGFDVYHGRVPGTDGAWLFDAIVEDKKVVFEFNGVYWHSYPRTRQGKHQYKRAYAEKAGYRMITIWEDDWRENRPRMESLIRRTLVGAETSIGARKLTVTPVDNTSAKAFHSAWHIQGYPLSIAADHYGLTSGGVLVAVATFDKAAVLQRYTVTEGLAIPGGLSRLIRAFRADHGKKDVTTYTDRDHFSGGVYKASGFEYVGSTLQMWYVRRESRESRQKYMRHKLPKVFGKPIPEGVKTKDFCAEHGVYEAFNSGTDKYILRAIV